MCLCVYNFLNFLDYIFLTEIQTSIIFFTMQYTSMYFYRHYVLRSTFCPQMGACLIATGSEDGAVHLLDSAREGKAARINRLLGHATPALALSFNYDESLLASADHDGQIILWRNHQRHL